MIEYTTYNSLESKISSIPWEPLPLFDLPHCTDIFSIVIIYISYLSIVIIHISYMYCDHLYIIPVYCDNLYIIPVYRDPLSIIHWKILRMNVLDICLMSISRFSLRDKVTLQLLKLHFYGADVVEWSRARDIKLSEWCCSVSMVWVQIPLTALKSNLV